MGINSYRKEFAPHGANPFHQELTPMEKGGKNENGKVASPESVPNHQNDNLVPMLPIFFVCD